LTLHTAGTENPAQDNIFRYKRGNKTARPYVDHRICRLAGIMFGNPSVTYAGYPAPWSSGSHLRPCLLASSNTCAWGKTGSVLDLALTTYPPLPSIRHATSSWLKGYRRPQNLRFDSILSCFSSFPWGNWRQRFCVPRP